MQQTINLFLLYATAYLGGVICWLPFLLSWRANLSDEINPRSFAGPSYIILGLTIPVTIHLACDIIAGTYTAALTRCHRLFSILIPCLVLLCHALPKNDVNAIFAIAHSQAILLLSGFVIRSHTCGRDIWRIGSSLFVLFCWASYNAAELYSLYAINSEAQQALYLFSWIFETLFLLFVIYKSISWFTWALPLYLEVRMININQFSCTKNVIILNTVTILELIFHACMSNENYAISSLFVFNLGTLLVIVLHDYVIAREAAKIKVNI